MKRKIPLLRPILNVSESDGITCTRRTGYNFENADHVPDFESGFWLSTSGIRKITSTQIKCLELEELHTPPGSAVRFWEVLF